MPLVIIKFEKLNSKNDRKHYRICRFWVIEKSPKNITWLIHLLFLWWWWKILPWKQATASPLPSLISTHLFFFILLHLHLLGYNFPSMFFCFFDLFKPRTIAYNVFLHVDLETKVWLMISKTCVNMIRMTTLFTELRFHSDISAKSFLVLILGTTFWIDASTLRHFKSYCSRTCFLLKV